MGRGLMEQRAPLNLFGCLEEINFRGTKKIIKMYKNSSNTGGRCPL